MRILLIYLLLIGLCTPSVISQVRPRSFTNEVSFALDNDVFLFIDRYYSAGHHFTYRTKIKKQSALNRIFNTDRPGDNLILSFNLGNEIYTSRTIRFANPANMDRPYAGLYYSGFSVNQLKGDSFIGVIEGKVGLVGDQTGIGDLQVWWHEQTGFREPRGWRSQIADEVIANLNVQLLKSIPLGHQIEMVSNSAIHAGTGVNKLSQGITVRFLNFRPLTQSVYSNASLGYAGDPDEKELFLFAGGGIDYVVSNVFLEGSLFERNPSPFTVEATPWVVRSHFGLMYARRYNSYSVTVNSLTKETLKGLSHSYVRLAISRLL